MLFWLGKTKPQTIRARLLAGFLLVALLPAASISVGAILIAYETGRQQALDRLESIALLRETQFQIRIGDLHDELILAADAQRLAPERITTLLETVRAGEDEPADRAKVRDWLQGYADQSPELDDLFVLDLSGRVVVSTAGPEGEDLSAQTYFQEGLKGPAALLPVNSTAPAADRVLIVSIPLYHENGTLLGVLAGHARPDSLSGILRERPGFKSFLVGPSRSLMSEAGLGTGQADSPGIRAVLAGQLNGSAVYPDHNGVMVLGIYRWLPRLRAGLLVEQDLAEVNQALLSTLALNAGTSLVSVALAVLVAVLITRSLARPLTSLVHTTARVASGDLNQAARVEGAQEIQALARSVNFMTAQLRDMVGGLEQRVEERTQALQAANSVLERRALQLETSARVSREIIAATDVNALLQRVVSLIQAVFDCDRAAIYLADSGADRPAATASRPAPSPDGPEPGRAELEVPLRAGGQLVGRLVLQGRPQSLTGEDRLVIHSLGDQIAVAIRNGQLYEHNRELAVLRERNRIASDLHDAVTQTLFSANLIADSLPRLWERKPLEGRRRLDDLRVLTRGALAEMRSLLLELRPTALTETGFGELLAQLAETVGARSGVPVAFHMAGRPVLPPQVQVGLYRIAQEALNNAVKHSAAAAIDLSLAADGPSICLRIRDNGCGFEPGPPGADQLGLGIMRERAETIGAALNVDSQPGKGTEIVVVWKPAATEGKTGAPHE